MDFLIGLLTGLFIGGWIGLGVAVIVMGSISDDSCETVIEETINTLKDKAEGYIDGYKQGIHDGNPFNALGEACARAVDSIKQIMTDPAVLDAIDRINKGEEVKRTCSLCGWCQTSDNPEDPENALVCANGACEHCGRLLGTLDDPIEVENCEGFEEPL